MIRSSIRTSIAAAAGNGSNRAVDFRDLPAEFVSRLEVLKSATPDMTEGGLGGTVRIITRRPFDAKEGYLAGSAQGIYNELADKVDPKFALIGSKLFAHDTIGVLLSGTYEDRTIRYDQARTTGWRQVETTQPATPANQNCLSGRNQARCVDLDGSGFGDFYPDIPRYITATEPTKRYALNGIVEWRPDDNFKAYVEGTFTKSNTRSDDQYLQLSTTQSVANGGIDPTGVVIRDETAQTVTFVNNSATGTGPSVNYRSVIGGLRRRTFNGIVAPAGTPRDILEKIRAETAKAVAVPALKERFDKIGIPLIASNSLDEFNAYLRRHVEDFAKLAKTAGITAN